MDSISDVTRQNIANPWTECQAHPFDAILANLHRGSSSIEARQDKTLDAFDASDIGQQIKLVRECRTTSQELYKLKESVDAFEDRKLTGGLTNLESLKSKFETVTGLVEKLEIIVKSQGKVQTMLQHPYSGPHIKMEAKYQSSIIELFQILSKSLVDLKDQLSILDWGANEFKETPDNLKEHLGDLLRRIENIKKINNF